ncbi:MAG: BMP family ABC transporter substrate-binding protein [Bacteroides sp.]|nr:BMP family ABC transporter substrate-binding protein [Bacteroides sp.]
MKNIKKKALSLLLAGCMIITGTGCNGGEAEEPEESAEAQDYVTVTDENGAPVTNEEGDVVTSLLSEEPQELELKVGFVYSGEAGSDSAGETFEAARAEIERSLDNTHTCYVENVLVSQFADATAALVEAGCNVIVSTDNRFANVIYEEAEANNSVYFISFGGDKPRANLACFQGEMYKGSYVCGLAAAFNSDSNILGIVADPSVMSVYNIVGGFVQGIKELNDKTHPDVRLNWAWGYSDEETKAAVDDLAAQGCDVIFAATYSKYAVSYCEELGIKVIGLAPDMPQLAPTQYITGCYYYLSIFLIDQLRNVRYAMGKAPSVYMGGVKEKAVRIIDFSESCREGTKDICDVLYQMAFDERTRIFTGEVKDTYGNVKIEKGATLSSDQIIDIDWLPENISVENDFTSPQLDPVEGSLEVRE